MAKRFYEPSSKSLESRDSGMLGYDRSAVANMPQDVKYYAWPKPGYYLDGKLDDTIRGIDKQIGEDDSGAKRHLKMNKW